jgi:glycosyltransferase involved in cell wall biosynthesis
MADSTVLVSVCMITYNHEEYIAQAIEGVMMQRTTFPIELVIGEDCSTDRTRKICLEYQEKYPDVIRLLLPEKNLGMQQNSIITLRSCIGKYIALCEGDDYWIDPNKLQKQVDFLEANLDFSICFHPVMIWKEGEIIDDYITREVPDTTTILDLAEGNYIHTPSVVFRKNQRVFDEFKTINSPVGDFVLHMLNAKYGKIKKIRDVMGVYRYGVGIWSTQSDTKNGLNSLSVHGNLIGYFSDEINSKLETVFLQIFNSIYSSCILENRKSEVEKHFELYPIRKELVESIVSNYLKLKQEKMSIKSQIRTFFMILKKRFSNKIKSNLFT